ncbi:50S ribosomal protein L23 [Candidatus Bathyarchaeota archaeon]|nr:50S ribosomal protein L23 [Candidatus Bathyarchaeota archaeon]MBS7630747.1 50S ribosomal protein L23 [Candidatus Bathyarchaeota archaeon]
MNFREVILFPLMSERSVSMIENENKLVFVVNIKASKSDIAKAVESLYEVEVESVQTMVDHKGQKKAFVKIGKNYSASDIAIKLGIL